MTTAEIIAALPRLSSAERAQVQATLHELARPSDEIARLRHVFSPRLVNPEQSTAFVKQVLEVAPDAKL